MSRILVPYDQSEQADHALEHALSTSESATVVLLHVVEPAGNHTGVAAGYEASRYPGQHENAEEMLDGVREAHDAGERIETAVRYGRPAHTTLSYLDEAGVDHIVIGSHGRDGAARLLLGSVAETVARRSPVPVTVVRQAPPSDAPEQVLVPFDGSTHSRRALTYALESFPQTDITALYVTYPTTDAGRDAAESDGAQGWVDERDDHAESVLSGATDIAADHDRSVETRSAAGTPADTIVEFVEQEEVGHVVLGSAGRDGIARLLLGSVAETVMRRSPASVTIAK
jgi:nucleotide-binding universal stress UspA family protein